MISVNNPPTTQLSTSQHVVTSNLTIPDGCSSYVARYIEIADGVTLEIGDDADLEIG